MRAALAMSLWLLLTPGWLAAHDLDERVPAKAGGLLQVDLDLGEEVRWERVVLEVRSHDADEVWAVADLTGVGSSTVTFRLEHDERVVRLYGTTGGVLSWILGGPGVSVRVWVPREYSLDLRCVSGPIRVENVIGEVRARTTDAAIRVSGAEGPVSLRTESGDVEVSDVRGDVVVKSNGGSLDLSWVAGRVEARTGVGSIRLRHVDGPAELRTDEGEVELVELRGRARVDSAQGPVSATFAAAPEGEIETRRGPIEVRYPAQAGFELDARTARGAVMVAGGTATGSPASDHFAGKVNGGGPLLRLYTAAGRIRVEKR